MELNQKTNVKTEAAWDQGSESGTDEVIEESEEEHDESMGMKIETEPEQLLEQCVKTESQSQNVKTELSWQTEVEANMPTYEHVKMEPELDVEPDSDMLPWELVRTELNERQGHDKMEEEVTVLEDIDPFANDDGSRLSPIPVPTNKGLVSMPFTCLFCGRNFAQRPYLKAHIRIHTGERPYKCQICEKRYYRRSQLTNHLKTHSSERKYKCNQCESSFNQRVHLTRHLNIHTGERPFKCDLCERTFCQNVHLTRHLKTHTGEKTHKCDQCGKGFYQRVHLTKHLKTHTPAGRKYKSMKEVPLSLLSLIQTTQ